ncbi:hypothetical protein FQZ97_899660 [compost metagenome]
MFVEAGVFHRQQALAHELGDLPDAQVLPPLAAEAADLHAVGGVHAQGLFGLVVGQAAGVGQLRVQHRDAHQQDQQAGGQRAQRGQKQPAAVLAQRLQHRCKGKCHGVLARGWPGAGTVGAGCIEPAIIPAGLAGHVTSCRWTGGATRVTGGRRVPPPIAGQSGGEPQSPRTPAPRRHAATHARRLRLRRRRRLRRSAAL